ncbi:MAG: thioredoxin domain-containing protein [Bacteroidota bacterium]|nr:thioredoxin domain-containing protein [Bacteroidota bacterium]
MEAQNLNRLAKASSPYLQQHANNPVNWYEWGEEALAKAKNENKPLLISIGYAACHWCHVMAHESFSDPTIAEEMNRHFVCIKVDREERPDIDQIYMEAAQLVSGKGGWPLNAFALPDGRPFYAATYFHPTQWSSLLQQLANLYHTDYRRIVDAAISLSTGISMNPFEMAENTMSVLSKADYDKAFAYMLSHVDFEQGGTKVAPKFMMPVGWEFMLQYHYLTGNEKALEAVRTTLNAMKRGGIYDQIGGGFARYSTDENWLVPHFEKMLYDNAQLISLYSHAYQIGHRKSYAKVVEQTIAFLERELLSPEGGYYSSIDADSEHEEGKFYVWTKTEFDNAVDPETAGLMADFYHIFEEGNWEKGKNILHYHELPSDFARENGIDPASFNELLERTNGFLLYERSKRIRPTTDDKILTAWNALVLTGYVDAYKALGKTEYLHKALLLAGFLKEKMLREGRLYRNYKNGEATVEAFLDDYALLAAAWIDLYQVTFDIHWLEQSRYLTEQVLEHFASAESPLSYYTSDESNTLFTRKMEVADNVIVSSNSAFAHVLLRLGALYDLPEYSSRAQEMLLTVGEQFLQGGIYYANWAMLAGKLTHPTCEVVITGKNTIGTALELQKRYLPNVIFAGGDSENLPLLKDRISDGETTIYVCHNKTCQLPVHTVEEAIKLL